MRRGDFMSEPEGGWLHQNQALAHGHGIFYAFPVRYIGSIQVMESLRSLDMAARTELCREAISRTIDGAKIRKNAGKRKVAKWMKGYLAEQPYVKVMDLKLNLGADGIATADLDSQQVISNDNITKISFAAGGMGEDYYFMTYVAKDKRDNRYCHIFDCGILADDVLATIGQIFVIRSDPKPMPPPVSTMPKGAHMGAHPTDNPMYFQGGAGATSNGEPLYDNNAGENYMEPQETYDAFKEEKIYDNVTIPGEVFRSGQDFAQGLNRAMPSTHIYGDEAEGSVYGGGATGWSYLEVSPNMDGGLMAVHDH